MNSAAGRVLSSTRSRGATISPPNRVQLVRDAYGVYESGERRRVEELLTEDFTTFEGDRN